jgi:hypothetical protein
MSDTTQSPAIENDGWTERPPAPAAPPAPARVAPTLPVDAAPRDKVVQFLKSMNVDLDAIALAVIGNVVGQFKAGFTGNFGGEGEEIPRALAEALGTVEGALKTGASDLEDDIVLLYRKHFSETEIDHLIAFYATATGRKLVAIGPILPQEIDMAANAWSNDVLKTLEPQLQQLLG